MKSLAVQVEATKIDANNLIPTMGSVEKIERLASAKDISTKLELRCKEFGISHLKSANILSKFVRDNCDNINLVMRLLHKCDGLLHEPIVPVKLVQESNKPTPTCNHPKSRVGEGIYYCYQCKKYA